MISKLSPQDNLSQTVKFNAAGTATEFSLQEGQDNYDILQDGQIRAVTKNGAVLNGDQRERLLQAKIALEAVQRDAHIRPYQEELQRSYLNRHATEEVQQEALRDLENLCLRSAGAEKESLRASIEAYRLEPKRQLAGGIEVKSQAASDANERTRIKFYTRNLNHDSALAELSDSQADLAPAALAGNKLASQWLNWTEAMKQVQDLRQKELPANSAKSTVTMNEQENTATFKSGQTTSKLHFKDGGTELTLLELSVPDPLNPGKFLTESLKPERPVYFDFSAGVISFSQRHADAGDLSGTVTRIRADGLIEINSCDQNGLRTKQTVRSIGGARPLQSTAYTYIDAEAKPADNPLTVKLAVAETRNSAGIISNVIVSTALLQWK